MLTESNTKTLNNVESPHQIDHQKFYDEIKLFVTKKHTKLDDNILNGFVAVLYLMVGILNAKNQKEVVKGFKIEIKSEMSIGAGLGSSASFGVCLAAAFTFYTAIQKNSNYPKLYKNMDGLELATLKESISGWAFCSEKIMHGNPSGLDNTICTFGNIVKFYKGSPPTEIKLGTPLSILLVDTRVSRSTAKLVAGVAALKQTFPSLVGHLLDGMGQLVDDAAEILKEFTGDDYENYEKLKVILKLRKFKTVDTQII